MPIARTPAYKTVKRDSLHYVFGYVGAGKYMQISDGLPEAKALEMAKRFGMAEVSAKLELRSWDGKRARD